MFRMDLSQIPLFAMLRGRMGYLSERQKVIAENVANSETPGFQPKDLQPFAFHAAAEARSATSSAAAPAMTQPGHMQPAAMRGGGPGGGSSGFKAVSSRDSETTLNGNGVVLEDQMLKLSDARMNYDAAIGFYQKSLGLLRMASRAPGR
jgi:flagellar basal-body rod protein FlgB